MTHGNKHNKPVKKDSKQLIILRRSPPLKRNRLDPVFFYTGVDELLVPRWIPLLGAVVVGVTLLHSA